MLEALKAGRALSDKERDIHDRGLVTLIRQHHEAIDAAVAQAYCWDDWHTSSPLPFRGGDGGGACPDETALTDSPHPNPSPEGEGLKGLSDEEILTRLVALNKARAAEEAKGLIRWLRPEFQAPGAQAPQVNAALDLGDEPLAAPASLVTWPKTLVEQFGTIAAILAAAPGPQHPADIARGIKGTNAKGVTPVLDTLAGMGRARRLPDGRYAA